MIRFKAVLVSGKRAPYTTWTFIEIPEQHSAALRGRVRGTLSGVPFRGTASRSGGVLRLPVPKALREQVRVSLGDQVAVSLEPDTEPPTIEIPAELRAILEHRPDLAAAFEALPPSHRRAWAMHVGEAKRPETRVRRAEKAIEGIRTRSFP